VSKRVSPIERVRADADELFASDRELGEVLEDVARLGVRLLMQSALEAEVTEFLGRERYVRSERVREGSRNGHCPTTIKTTSGPVALERPTAPLLRSPLGLGTKGHSDTWVTVCRRAVSHRNYLAHRGTDRHTHGTAENA
jgi:hypothetical protein